MIVLQVDGVEIKKSSTCTTWSLSSSILKGIHQIPGDGDDGDGVGGDGDDDDGVGGDDGDDDDGVGGDGDDGDGVGGDGDNGDGDGGDDGDDDGDLLVRRISHLDLILFRSRLISKGVWRFTLWKVNSRVRHYSMISFIGLLFSSFICFYNVRQKRSLSSTEVKIAGFCGIFSASLKNNVFLSFVQNRRQNLLEQLYCRRLFCKSFKEI